MIVLGPLQLFKFKSALLTSDFLVVVFVGLLFGLSSHYSTLQFLLHRLPLIIIQIFQEKANFHLIDIIDKHFFSSGCSKLAKLLSFL